MRKVYVILTLVVFALGQHVDAARRRVRSTTAAAAVTAMTEDTTSSHADRQLAFAGQPEELETLWNNYDIQKLDARSEPFGWRPNRTSEESHDETEIHGRQYPGLPAIPDGETNELPNPISPQPSPPPSQKLPPGCLGPRGQYPSPKSCANYLNCWDDIVVEQTCPDGLLFNDLSNVCDYSYNVKCGNRPPATPKPPLSPGSKRCPDPNGRYRSSTNCSEFYICVVGNPVKFCCPYGLAYNDILNVCDYPYNVNCKGAAAPKPTQPPTQSTHSSTSRPPTRPTQPPAYPTQPPAYPTQPPAYPTQPPIYPTYPTQPPTQPPTYPTHPPTPATHPTHPPTRPTRPPTNPTHPPTYPTQPPTYPTKPPSYQPQPPTYRPPQPPSYQPQPYPIQPSSPYQSGNSWLSKEPNPWHQRPLASQLEIDRERFQQETTFSNQLQNETETFSLTNPWTLSQALPPELAKTPCNNGDVHRLNEACTNMMVCRNNKPQLVRCTSSFSYDKPSDSCKPFSIAKC